MGVFISVYKASLHAVYFMVRNKKYRKNKPATRSHNSYRPKLASSNLRLVKLVTEGIKSALCDLHTESHLKVNEMSTDLSQGKESIKPVTFSKITADYAHVLTLCILFIYLEARKDR